MQRITFSKKAIAGAVAAGVLLLLLIVFAFSREFGIGQAYQSVTIDGETIGYVSENVNISSAIKAARRELANAAEERICMDFTWNADTVSKPFVRLMQQDKLNEKIKEVLAKKIIDTNERAYTVAIDDYRGNFATLEEVKSFLNKVKAGVDENSQYMAEVTSETGHINGIMQASLTESETTEETAVTPEETLADEIGSGAFKQTAYALGYAVAKVAADPQTGAYQTGILNLEFVENVEVYENYVKHDELDQVEEQVAEVTKEKESNKIYEVVSGDCLSVIAMDHDTSVSSIMALNDLADADAIREGQELIIAVPEPDLKVRLTMGEVYEEDYEAEPVVVENTSWYTTKEVVLEEGTTGHRERNDVVVYESGTEVSREMLHQNIMTESKAQVVERGTIIPPTYIKPVSGGRFTSGFGYRWGRLHKGVDWACPVGTTVFASCAGTVIQAAYNGGYGNNVVISHVDGRLTRYAHNSKLLVKAGQKVEQGDPIALSGSTGRSTGPHVHFEIYINGTAVNPLKYISN